MFHGQVTLFFKQGAMHLLLQLQAIGGLFALAFFYYLWTGRSNYGKTERSRSAPEPAGAWPVIGHLHLFGSKEPLFRTLGAMADKYGPAFVIRLGLPRVLVVSSWEVVKDCFTTNDKVLASRPCNATGKYLAYDYTMFGFAPYGPYWREIRKIATLELLSNRRLEMLKLLRASEIDRCIKDLYSLGAKENGTQPVKVEMGQWFGDLTFNVVVKMVVGDGCVRNDNESRRFREAINRFAYLSGVVVVSDALPFGFLRWLDLQGYVRAMKKTAEELGSVIVNCIDEHRRRRVDGVSDGDHDFIDVMQSILEKEAQNFDHDPHTIIKATCLGLILGGSESTAVTLTWALSLLLNNRHVLKKAQDEVDLHVGKERHVDESDIKNLVYLQAIIKETLRMYPAAPLLIPHEAIEDCQVSDYHVAKGTRVLVNAWKLQRDPRVWSDPLEFQPERFLTNHAEVDVRGQHFEFIPFGSGRRPCPGISSALQILHLTLARLLHGFELTIPFDATIDMAESLGLTSPKAAPLEVLFTPRLPIELYIK